MTKSKSSKKNSTLCVLSCMSFWYRILKKRLDLHKDDWRAAYSMRNAEFESVSTPLSTTNLPTAPPPQQQKSLKLKINLTKQQATTSKASSPRLSASTPKVGTKLPPAMKILTGKPKAVMPIKVFFLWTDIHIWYLPKNFRPSIDQRWVTQSLK